MINVVHVGEGPVKLPLDEEFGVWIHLGRGLVEPRISGLATSALAIESNCFCPVEMLVADSRSCVHIPEGAA